jgi:hypothetical protein
VVDPISRGLAQLPQPAETPRDAIYWIGRPRDHERQTYANITKQPDGDDDLLEIRFCLADPAISKLKAD